MPRNRLFYLALPPQAVPQAVQGLGEAGLAQGPGWTRVVVEKPFGHDLASAKALNSLLARYFREDQLFRIDHYLGKETVQN
ncbi:MAG TPA: glucose-6-phosphate dehydrogenase, partial [Candidatus Acetothermia bacterium]|nr:glucose-6-phosphate dehydrogenase [Candidatus Acetothermia bacterium]